MARLPRLVIPGQAHLLIQRAIDRQPIFEDAEDLALLTEVLRLALVDEQVQLHAYALRPQELLLLATPAQPQSLARLMQTIGLRYVSAFNRLAGRGGTLWNGRFRAAPVEPGEPLLAAMAWIEQDAEPGAATSAAHHLGSGRDPLVTDPPAYWSLGNTPFAREAAWRERLSRGSTSAQDAAPPAAAGRWARQASSRLRVPAAAPRRRARLAGQRGATRTADSRNTGSQFVSTR